MSKFQLNKENAPFIAQAFAINSANAKSIIRIKYDITDEDFAQIYANYNFDKLKSYLPGKPKVNKFLKDRKELKRAGVHIDSENKSISYPWETVKPEHKEYILNLVSIVFTLQHTTFSMD